VCISALGCGFCAPVDCMVRVVEVVQ